MIRPRAIERARQAKFRAGDVVFVDNWAPVEARILMVIASSPSRSACLITVTGAVFYESLGVCHAVMDRMRS